MVVKKIYSQRVMLLKGLEQVSYYNFFVLD